MGLPMNLGIVNEETWAFFDEVYQELNEYHSTQLFARRHSKSPLLKTRLDNYYLESDFKKLMQQNQVVFFEWASELLSVASHLSKTCGIVTRLHRYEMYQWADRIHWGAVDKIILVSHAKKREFEKKYPEHGKKVVVIPEAVSPGRFPSQRKKVEGDIGILCHLSPRKRVYELILAFSEIHKQRGDLHLHIGGGPHPRFPDYVPALYGLVKDLRLEKKVTFYGAVTNPQEWYSKIDIFISNSYSEGLQVSPMEAIVSGCYCLSHRWDGADELLPEENLFYSEREFIQKVISFIDLCEIEQSEKVAGLQKMVIEKFNIDDTKVQIRELIEEVGATFVNKNGKVHENRLPAAVGRRNP
jgi:glycosyltransferase involved in cell wall biosynthesis